MVKKLLIILILIGIFISGCSEPSLELIGKKLKLSQNLSDCKKNQYYDASEHKCKKIINECYTDGDCPGEETCIRKEISTSLACKVGEECPRWYHDVCELTEETKKYCKQDSDCGIQFTCCCFEALNKKFMFDVECKEDVLCSPCPWSPDSTLVKCINHQCKLVSKWEYCGKDEDCVAIFRSCSCKYECSPKNNLPQGDCEQECPNFEDKQIINCECFNNKCQ